MAHTPVTSRNTCKQMSKPFSWTLHMNYCFNKIRISVVNKSKSFMTWKSVNKDNYLQVMEWLISLGL